MNRKSHCLIVVLAVLFISAFSFAQFQEEGSYKETSLKPYLGFEYFSRTIEWDEEESSSRVKSYFFTFGAEYELQKGFSIGAFLGYAFSDYESLIFRQLPFSLELEVGGIGGFMLGVELKKSILSIENFEIGGIGQFVYHFGGKEEWDIPGLNVEGRAEGKPSWMRAQIGPMIVYNGDDSLHPYLFLSFNKFWGTFNMKQTIADLEGKEEKKISGKSLFNSSLGALYDITKALSLEGQASLLPFKDGVDFGVMIRAIYSF